MPIELTPRIYSKNFRWGVLPRNKIDTFSAEVTLNTPLGAATNLTQEITDVNVAGNPLALPVALNTPLTHFLASNNYEEGQSTTMAINQVSCVVATGSVTFSIAEPLPTMPSAKLHLTGTTYYTNRGALTHEQAAGAPVGNGLAQWIFTNSTGNTEWTDKSTDPTNRAEYDDPTLVDYTGSSVPLFGWVRKLKPAGSFIPVSDRNQPVAQDGLTTWVDQSKSDHWALTENWSGYGTAESVQMWPVTLYAKGDMNSTKISLRNRNVPIIVKVIKVDDYTYKVEYSVPVRYEYIASSQYYTSTLGIRTYHDLDSYSFLDRISKITIELVTTQLNTETVNVSYSLGGTAGTLTTDVLNEHPINFVKNELITSQAYVGSSTVLWTNYMANHLLTKFENGKYIVECEVPATWALRNDIHINSQLKIQLQDGTYIARNSNVCVFEVKTIEKRFRNTDFIFSLRLMEV